MAEDSTTWLIQHEVAQSIVARNKPGLFPDGFARWRSHTTHYDIPHFTCCVAADHMDDFGAFHGATFPFFAQKRHFGFVSSWHQVNARFKG
jgi:hypothetical protein